MQINFLDSFKQGHYYMQYAVKPNNKKIAFEIKSVIADSKVYKDNKKYYINLRLDTTNSDHVRLLSYMKTIKTIMAEYLCETRLANKSYSVEDIMEFYENDGLFICDDESDDESDKISDDDDINDDIIDKISDNDDINDENNDENDENIAKQNKHNNEPILLPINDDDNETNSNKIHNNEQKCKPNDKALNLKNNQKQQSNNPEPIILIDKKKPKNTIKTLAVEIHPDCQILKTNGIKTFLESPENIEINNVLDIIIVFTGLKYNTSSFSAKYHLYKIKKQFQWEFDPDDLVFNANNDNCDENKYIQKYAKTFNKSNK